MGQQQLLLLVLGIVIVGLAVVVGIQAFSENQDKSRQDAIQADLARISSDLSAWILKPTAMGGGGGNNYLEGGIEDLGYEVNGAGHYENANALYNVSSIDPDYFEVFGCHDGTVYEMWAQTYSQADLNFSATPVSGDCASELTSRL